MPGASESQYYLERSVIESLRTGVPGRHAVRILGSGNHAIREHFRNKVEACRLDGNGKGFMVEGGFGSGKSHLLATLREAALDANFACSIVTVSKEMTLGNVADLFASAIRELRLPGKSTGGTCAEFVSTLRFDSDTYLRVAERYTLQDESIESIFGASLQIFERYQSSVDVLDAMIDFWDGGRCPLTQIKRELRALDLPYKHLGRQPGESRIGFPRMQFISSLLRAAGYDGWTILIDECEMIAKFGLLSRARSYAILASLLGSADFLSVGGIVAVGAITLDLWSVLLDQRNDREALNRGVRARYPSLADEALAALDFLLQGTPRFELKPPRSDELAGLRDLLRGIYERAYAMQLPAAQTPIETDAGRTLRSHLKEWITDWDIRRQYPGYVPALERDDQHEDLTEDQSFEAAPDTDD